MNKNQFLKFLGSIALIILVALFLYWIFAPPAEPDELTTDEEVARIRKDIDSLSKELWVLEIQNRKLLSDYDSLLKVESHVIYKSREKLRFVYLSDNPSELDSVVRSGWRPDTGYHPMLRAR